MKPFAFRGLFRCGECGRQITAETRIKPSGKSYTYYRCTKKNRVCRQKYIEEKILIKQINKIFQKVAFNAEWKNYFLAQWKKDYKEISTAGNACAQNLKADLRTVEIKLNRLLDAYLDQAIDRGEYAAKKQKLLNRKVEIGEEIENFGRKRLDRLGLFKNWILDAYKAKFILESENLAGKKDFLQKIGSDFRILNQKPQISLQSPWNWSADKITFSSMSCLYQKVRTYFLNDGL